MNRSDRFRVNSPSVAWEDFGDETILVNLETGEYFSTRDSGAELWRRLATGTSLATAERAMLALYNVDPALLWETLASFVAALQTRGLLVSAEDANGHAVAEEPTVAMKRDFVPPSIETYSDMQDLLLLDPIHEVDESGWPNPK